MKRILILTIFLFIFSNVVNASEMNGENIDKNSPASITNLRNVSYASNYIKWTWKDPKDSDFSKVMIYINGKFKTNVTKGKQYYYATNLISNKNYKISTHTVDTSGNINHTWINRTTRTAPAKNFLISNIRNIPPGISPNIYPYYNDNYNFSDKNSSNDWSYSSKKSSWIVGFYPAALSWIYKQTKLSTDNTKAINTIDQWYSTDNVDVNTHDQYFLSLPYVKGIEYNLPINSTKKNNWTAKIIAHADRLANIQFNSTIGAVTTTTTSRIVIADSMTAVVPLLIWGYKNTADTAKKNNYMTKLNSHVNVILRDFFKSTNDGSVWGRVEYNADGTVRRKYNGQLDENIDVNDAKYSWTRAQAWTMYGLIELYEFTKDDRYKDRFDYIANFWINSIYNNSYSDNGIMKNTIGLTTGKYDTSGTSIVTASLFKMYKLTGNKTYLNTAKRSFNRLLSYNYFKNGRLIHAFQNVGFTTDAEIIHGDYYLTETFEREENLN